MSYTAPLIIFKQRSEPLGSQTLAEGSLECFSTDGSGLILPATSGAPGFQSNANYWTVGKGPLPPGVNYSVKMEPEPKEARGIEGDFFRVHPVKMTNGATERAGFGIHRDANAPGSAGCIVILGRLHFARFTVWALTQLELGFPLVKLEARYN